MASDFPAGVTEGIEFSEVQEYTPSQTGSETAAKAGELMFFDTSDQKVKRCGANPSLIAGIAEVDSEKARVLTPNGKIPIRVLHPRCGVRLCSATTPAESHVGNSYDIARLSSGNWALVATQSNTRVTVYRVDIATGAFFVHFIAANLQLDAIAS